MTIEYMSDIELIKEYRQEGDTDCILYRLNSAYKAWLDNKLPYDEYERIKNLAFYGKEVISND